MIMDKIVQIIEKLKHNTSSRLQELQESKVPAVYKMKSEIQQTYTVDGQEFVYNNGVLILLIKNLPIYFNLDRQIFSDSMINMVNNKEIHPFLIFLDGKFIKWSDIKLVHDFKDRYIIIENFNLEDYYTSLKKTATMLEIFSEWKRFSHYIYGKFPAYSSELLKWKYVESTGLIDSGYSVSYTGVVSDKKYSNYIHQVTVASNTDGYGVIGVIIAFHKDEYGKEHTLSAIRSSVSTGNGITINGATNQVNWCIVYNFRQSNEKVVAEGYNSVTKATGDNDKWNMFPNGCIIRIERTETSVTATTSQLNSTILDNATKLNLDLNSEPVLKLFLGSKQYGYSSWLQNSGTYKNVSFVDLRDNIILPEASMVTVPFNVKYAENQTSLTSKNIFAFKEDGLCTTTLNGITGTAIDLDDPYIYYEGKYLTPGKIQSTNMNTDYKISKINPLLFKNGKLSINSDIKFHGLNTFLVDDGGYNENNILYKLFYYIYSNPSKDNILNIPNKTTAINKITNTTTPPEYMKSLAIPFDFKFNKNKTYYENVSNTLDYIMQYNPALLNDVYKDLNKISVLEYTGAYILSISNINGYVTMNRGNKNGLNYPIILVNGELFIYYHHTTYRGNDFTFISKGILPTDIVEILMFKDIDNKVLESKILSSNYDDTYYLHSDIDIHDLRIFSDDAYDKAYDIPNSNYRKYPVEFVAERISESKINITLKDSYYYDRKLYFSSSRQFRYFYKIIKEDTINITLPVGFAFCKNKNNYMIFVNGRKIDNADFQFTKVSTNSPFDDLSLYIGIPLSSGHKVDIFYVPEEMNEVVTSNNIPTTGNIFVNKTKLPYAFSKDLYFVFMNGKKISNNSILDINSHKAKILTNAKTINNLSIIRHSNDISLINEMFSTNVNIYDTVVDSLNIADLDALYSNGNTITDIESNIKIGKIDNAEITKQVIKDYWLRTITTKINSDELPEILSYEYEETIPYTDKDSDGNNIIK